MDNKLLIHPITAPSLTEANYGDNLSQQFENIDANFHILGNQDFIKGQPGDGVKIENIKIINPYNMTSSADGDENIEELSIEASEGIGLYEALKKAVWDFANNSKSRSVQSGVSSSSTGDIMPVSAEDPLSNIGDYAWDDNITKGDFYIPVIIYENKVNDTKEYICSAGVVSFFDNRFSASALDKNQFSEYSNNVVDVTSLLNFKKINGVWTCELNLSFPRLKYKDNTFYWVINDDDTLIKSTGIKGDRGEPGTMWIGKVTELPREYGRTKVQVEGFLKNNKWDDSVPDGMKVGDPIVVYCTTVGGIYNGFFITRVFSINNDVVDVEYDPDMNITYINYAKNTKEFLKLIGSQSVIEGTHPARGLFLLVDQYEVNADGTAVGKESDISDYYAHMIYNNAYELNISPVQNYEFEGKYPELIDDTNLKLNIDYNTNIRNGLEVEAGGLTVHTGGASITGTTKIKGVTTINGDTTIAGSTTITGSVDANGEVNVNGSISAQKYVKTPVIYALGTGDGTGRHGIVFGVERSEEYLDDYHSHDDNHNACIYGKTEYDLCYDADSHKFTGNTSVTGALSASNGLTISGGGAVINGVAEIDGDETVSGYISTEKYVKTPVIYALGTGDGTGRHGIVFGVERSEEYLDDEHSHMDNHNACIYGKTEYDLCYDADSHKFTGNTSVTGALSASNGLTISGGGASITGAFATTGTINLKNNATDPTGQLVINSSGKTTIKGSSVNVNGPTTIGGATTINGNLSVSSGGSLSVNSDITSNGKVSASNGFYETSDERLKDFHEDIEVCLDDITKLPKKYFTWKDDDTKTSNIGTSAQEVQKLYPELVSENENGILSVSYDKLSIVALKAIDELYKKNQELEERIKKLEKLLK